ncbi:helix-turn-helix domain-containing protein [Sodalis sp. RH21]|uniref:helix-turn-helix domain-containing protein n=1 Tax=unclassified Sodalis (in: enterobacteria) TaxID=2636512 RepID=UPI0039B4A713
MNKDNIVLPSTLLVANAKQDITDPRCWLLDAREQDCLIRFQSAQATAKLNITQGWRGILVMNRVNLEVLAGRVNHQELPLFALVKLQVFIDESRGLSLKYDQQQHWQSIKLSDYPQIATCSDVERWLLSQTQALPEEMAMLAAFLRRTEWYWLIRFLLNESVNSDKLHELGERYGLSYSHFRRLCRNALGNSAKNELRGWRIARALLDVVEEGQSLTEAAMRHGYASSSHLSNDIRDAFGVSPRGLWNMINKKSEK